MVGRKAYPKQKQSALRYRPAGRVYCLRTNKKYGTKRKPKGKHTHKHIPQSITGPLEQREWGEAPQNYANRTGKSIGKHNTEEEGLVRLRACEVSLPARTGQLSRERKEQREWMQMRGSDYMTFRYDIIQCRMPLITEPGNLRFKRIGVKLNRQINRLKGIV